jgi:transposase
MDGAATGAMGKGKAAQDGPPTPEVPGEVGGPAAYAGVDWASRRHALCVVATDGNILAEGFFSHTERGIRGMIDAINAGGARRVAIERPDGLLVDRMVQAGLAVMPVAAGALIAVRPRYAVFGAKSDSLDAFCLAELARTDSRHHQMLAPDSDQTRTLRQLTRAREDLVDARVRLGQQLRAQLEGFWPGGARLFTKIESRIALAFLRTYPSPADARDLDERALADFMREHRYGGRNGRSPAQLLERLCSAPTGNIGETETLARRALVIGLVTVIEAIMTEIDDLDSRIHDAVHAHPDGKIFLPLFRGKASFQTAALLVAEIGDDRGRYLDSDSLAAKAGVVPVVRASGTRHAVHFRVARNKRLQKAVVQLADATRRHNPWARMVYEAARARGHRHPHALRVLGRAWLQVLWRCWQDGLPYDPEKHGGLRRLEAGEVRGGGD